MARYKVLAPSFINNTLFQEGDIVDINDDPTNGGMAPGANLARVDEDGELEASKPARKSRKPAFDDGADLA